MPLQAVSTVKGHAVSDDGGKWQSPSTKDGGEFVHHAGGRSS